MIGIREIGWCDIDVIDMAQNIERWRALVDGVINLRVP
jgi:hypothetical protein